MKKPEARKKLLLAMARNIRRSCWIKKGVKPMHGETKTWKLKLMHVGKTSLQQKSLNQNGRIIFECREVFTNYVMCRDHF